MRAINKMPEILANKVRTDLTFPHKVIVITELGRNKSGKFGKVTKN